MGHFCPAGTELTVRTSKSAASTIPCGRVWLPRARRLGGHATASHWGLRARPCAPRQACPAEWALCLSPPSTLSRAYWWKGVSCFSNRDSVTSCEQAQLYRVKFFAFSPLPPTPRFLPYPHSFLPNSSQKRRQGSRTSVPVASAVMRPQPGHTHHNPHCSPLATPSPLCPPQLGLAAAVRKHFCSGTRSTLSSFSPDLHIVC